MYVRVVLMYFSHLYCWRSRFSGLCLRLQKQGMATACCELAYEGLGLAFWPREWDFSPDSCKL